MFLSLVMLLVFLLLMMMMCAGVAKAQELKLVPDEAPNPTDVEESIQKLKDNDSKLKNLNLNNIKVSSS